MAVTRDTAFYTALRSEIELDPAARGYAPFRASGSDGAIADLLDVVIVGNTVTDGAVSAVEFRDSLVLAEMGSLTAPQLQLIEMYSRLGVDLNVARVKTNLQTMFPATGAGTTQTAILKKANRDGSRAEKLWGIGTVINSDDVSVARVLANGPDGKPGW